MTPQFQPLPLKRSREPFSHPDWIFEIKWDGFRSLARVEHNRCRLISRNNNDFKSFSVLNESLRTEIKHSVVLDGEIVCLDVEGKPQFRDLLFHRGEPRFVAFDCLWCDGEDLRYMSLVDRKRKLRTIIPQNSDRLLYCDHVEGMGEGLFKVVCEKDLEGIVAKRRADPYLSDTKWIKIRNQKYSQWAGREDLFERERDVNPDLRLWDACTTACMS